jgi:flagellar biosynthetic protein FlhB
MAGNQNGERTEKPSGKRLQDARKRGQVARSREAAYVASVAAALVALSWIGAQMMHGMGLAVIAGLNRVGQTPTRAIEPGELASMATHGLMNLAVLVGPLALATAVASIGMQVAQGGWVIASEAITLDWSRLNPVTGLQRLAPSRAGLDTVRMIVSVVVLAWISVRVIQTLMDQSLGLARVAPFDSATIAWASLRRLLLQATIALGIISIGDYALQRWRLMSSLKMTKQEVKDENKQLEGNPEIKGRVRRVQMDMVRRRMLAAVAKSTVVITNPTEYAVALEYHRASMPAPRVVARGRGLLAARIKAIAREHGVPTVENVPLAQALYRGTEPGDIIPADLFEAVAEVLAYLIRLKQLVL